MKKTVVILTSFLLTVSLLCINVFATFRPKTRAESISAGLEFPQFELTDEAFSTYLIEASTGKVLHANNEFASAAPASVTKIMTLLLICEAIDSGKISLNDTVSVSANAASKGGSQVFLKEGERMSVLDLLKSTVIASANDAAVALAELVAGSESSFVKLMNKRSAELGLKNTAFENPTGLDDTTTNHYTCAADIAAMSRELIKHDVILEYSSMWQDSIRNGEFILTNTNRLVRYYDGCNGLKTGSTDKAGFCISATAKRGDMQLIAVVMGSPTKDVRNNIARQMLDFGFANFGLYNCPEAFLEKIPVVKGKVREVNAVCSEFSVVVPKSHISEIEKVYEMPEKISAPMKSGDKIGRVIYKINGNQIGFSDVFIESEIPEIKYFDVFSEILKKLFCI